LGPRLIGHFPNQFPAARRSSSTCQIAPHGSSSSRNPASALPAWLRDSRAFVAGLNLLDDALTALAPVFAHNWFFVLRKR
jgi:hypothetical protein